MLRQVRSLLQTVPRLLNQRFKLCWLVPRRVSNHERIVRAIFSPYHVDSKRRLKHSAYDPTPKTDEISIMRLDYMGSSLCKRKAQSFENLAKKKEYRGLAVLNVGAVRNIEMAVGDSREHFCGHGDIKFLIEELRHREPGEPLSAEANKRFKDLKDMLVSVSNYVPDPDPRGFDWHGAKLEAPIVE